jgi:hypothetical protein
MANDVSTLVILFWHLINLLMSWMRSTFTIKVQIITLIFYGSQFFSRVVICDWSDSLLKSFYTNESGEASFSTSNPLVY